MFAVAVSTSRYQNIIRDFNIISIGKSFALCTMYFVHLIYNKYNSYILICMIKNTATPLHIWIGLLSNRWAGNVFDPLPSTWWSKESFNSPMYALFVFKRFNRLISNSQFFLFFFYFISCSQCVWCAFISLFLFIHISVFHLICLFQWISIWEHSFESRKINGLKYYVTKYHYFELLYYEHWILNFTVRIAYLLSCQSD